MNLPIETHVCRCQVCNEFGRHGSLYVNLKGIHLGADLAMAGKITPEGYKNPYPVDDEQDLYWWSQRF